jgi:hypothetical protein
MSYQHLGHRRRPRGRSAKSPHHATKTRAARRIMSPIPTVHVNHVEEKSTTTTAVMVFDPRRRATTKRGRRT